ncbi:SDR family NAD(P)-dependent oxidoreductase [Streptomonospora wellingtoniae]|uniref:SDR family oxidoreductase n=1 Tax=Streptomonospora wellingtoniae TaxID=3075544 RepID=A0ABU2KRX2_9ACTN|nr:SDR family oxidoreductase [Streptomonospora sp. DSM 45055]MDT0302024.1 SDR family oxidoreductase [Streptomonospora sp. DSM 45055]
MRVVGRGNGERGRDRSAAAVACGAAVAGTAAAAGAAGIAALCRRRGGAGLVGRTALVTGGSRGLGLLIARELGRRGCRVLVAARSADALGAAVADLRGEGADAHGLVCDLARDSEVTALAARVCDEYGGVDVLVNNAGVIRVGPAAAMSEDDVAQALDTMFWGPLRLTRALLPGLRERRGRVVTITSIGGRISVPHLLPYSCAKFAEVALSRGLDAETAGSGVRFTTVVPGLMRTGSHLGVEVTGSPRREYIWFAAAAGLPVLSMDAERAARTIVSAALRGRRHLVLTPAARAALIADGISPGLVQAALRTTARLLPHGESAEVLTGAQARRRTGAFLRALTRLNDNAARRFNQVPGLRGGGAADGSGPRGPRGHEG